MSYARFGWNGSDVYVYGSDRGFECCGCWLNGGGKYGKTEITDTPEKMIAHLQKHRDAGYEVPDETMEGLQEEARGERQ